MQNPYVFGVGDAEALEGRAASVFDIAGAEAAEELEAVVSKVLDERRAAREDRRLRRRSAVHAREEHASKRQRLEAAAEAEVAAAEANERKTKVPNTIAKRKAFAKMDSWEQRRLLADWVMSTLDGCWQTGSCPSWIYEWAARAEPPPSPEWVAGIDEAV